MINETNIQETYFKYGTLDICHVTYHIGALLSKAKDDEMIIKANSGLTKFLEFKPSNPQKEWTTKQKASYIKSLICNLPSLPFFIVNFKDECQDVLLDGHQRLKAIQEFINGDFSITDLFDTNEELLKVHNLENKCIHIQSILNVSKNSDIMNELYEYINNNFVM